MNELEQARAHINQIDERMAALFEERMEAAQQVAAYKKAHNLPVYDEKREQQVIERNGNRLKNQVLLPYYIRVLHTLMEVSKDYQKALLSEENP